MTKEQNRLLKLKDIGAGDARVPALVAAVDKFTEARQALDDAEYALRRTKEWGEFERAAVDIREAEEAITVLLDGKDLNGKEKAKLFEELHKSNNIADKTGKVVDAFTHMREASLPARILKLMAESEPSTTFQATELAQLLDAERAHVAAALSRLNAAGRIMSVSRGVYMLPHEEGAK